jgi:hypothetical protein
VNTDTLIKECGFIRLTGDSPREIEGAFAGDLLSWAMSRVQKGDIWFTVMGNINAVAVASLSDCAGIVLCHGSALAEDAKHRAEREGIVILRTELPVYEAVTSFNRLWKK